MKRIEELEDTWEVTNPIVMREKVNEVINAVNTLIDTVNRRGCAPWLDRQNERDIIGDAIEHVLKPAHCKENSL